LNKILWKKIHRDYTDFSFSKENPTFAKNLLIINMKFRELAKKIMPAWMRSFYYMIKRHQYDIKIISLRKKIVSYLELLKKEQGLLPEQQETLDFLYTNRLSVFPNEIYKKYSKKDVKVIFDKSKGMNYVLFSENKRLYFKKKWSSKQIAEYFNALKIEQDKHSPHCYLSDTFDVKEGSVVADIGAAEGFFSLGIIDTVKKIYLFEPDFEWIEPLCATFEAWKEKVEIVPKYISDTSGDDKITLDDFFNGIEEAPTFIKADVEGCEKQLLNGAVRLMDNSSGLRFALCTYHKQNDYEIFLEFLSEKRFNVTHSDGYMIFYLDKHLALPYLRRGVIRASK
jgi:predicted RNA methylase